MATTVVSARSARLPRSSSQSGKYDPVRSRGSPDQCACAGVESAVPIAVAGVGALAAALTAARPHRASASAPIKVWMNRANSSRNTSGLALVSRSVGQAGRYRGQWSSR